MSFETVLLLAVFVLLPLIQLAVRAARQGEGSVPDHAEGGVPSTKQPTKPEPAMAAPAVPPLPPTAHPVPHAMMPRTRNSRRDARELAVLGPTAHHGGQWHTPAVAGLDDRSGLRRAIVLTAILGPCRAHESHARSESGLP